MAAALGPDHRLARVLARRLAEALDAAGEAAPEPVDEIVMVSAGSSDPRAGQDCERVAAMLSEVLGHPVSSAYLSAARPSLPDALVAARGRANPRDDAAGSPRTDAAPARPGRVLLVPYLLAPGFFHGRALAAGADVTAQPLLVHPGDVPPELVELVVEHYREAASEA